MTYTSQVVTNTDTLIYTATGTYALHYSILSGTWACIR